MNLCPLCCYPPLPRSCELCLHSFTHSRYVVVLVSVRPQSLVPLRQKLYIVELSIPLAVTNLVYPSSSESSPSSLSGMGVLPGSNATLAESRQPHQRSAMGYVTATAC
jgi:hypothetical protein